jgi:chromosome segregation ATPase
MTDDMDTRPTIETILEAIRAVDQKLDQRIDALERKVDERFEQVYTELDRVASVVFATKAEMLTLRVDFREMRAHLKELLPALEES